MNFKHFLTVEQEAPPSAPSPAPAGPPVDMGAAPPALPPPMPPMGGGLDAGLGAPPPVPGAQAPPIKLKTSNVWQVLKELLSEKPDNLKDQSTPNSQDVLEKGDKPQHLMGI